MAIELNSMEPTCFRCGHKYNKYAGYFYVSYGSVHKGVGYIPVCKECIDSMYKMYFAQCNNERDATRQMCRKLDLYWSNDIYEDVLRRMNNSPVGANKTMIARYIMRMNNMKVMDKSYDDTLNEETAMWDFKGSSTNSMAAVVDGSIAKNTPQEIIDFWGSGYTDDMYAEFEKRREYWKSKLPPEVMQDVGAEAIIKQICTLEVDITRDRIEGKPVDKSVNVLNTLLGSANLKPTQQKGESDNSLENVPMGVWIQKYETQKPIPEADPELEDVDGLLKYIITWFYGHLSKMLNIKNSHSKLYDDAIDKLRVDHPEYADEEDDDEFLYDIFKDSGDGEDGE